MNIFDNHPEFFATTITKSFYEDHDLSYDADWSDIAKVYDIWRKAIVHFWIDENNLFFTKQMHSDSITMLPTDKQPEGDGLITNKENIFMGVYVADCAPIFLYDPITRTAAVVHAWRRGSSSNISSKMVVFFKEKYWSNPRNILAYIWPCISQRNFEFWLEAPQYFEEKYLVFDAEKQKYFVDILQCNVDQLLDGGVEQKNIKVDRACTFDNNENLFSYRREGKKSWRLLAICGIRSNILNPAI